MNCLVTGAAGFIGSHLCEDLVARGCTVRGLDTFIDYYPRGIKEANLDSLRSQPRFSFHEADLRSADLTGDVRECEVIFHLAAMPGLPQSWTEFDRYWTCNAAATKRLLDALVSNRHNRCKFIYVSTSSVYGKFASGDENLPTRPVSPYGITKLAGEHLCRAYGEAFGVHYAILRYFSVYGPRQRPDMGYHRFIRAILAGEEIVVYGDGHQVRGNTFVQDCVKATAEATSAPSGEVYNIGGGEMVSVWDVIHLLEQFSDKKANVRLAAERPGDQRHTFADSSKARRDLQWKPLTSFQDGLRSQWEWQKNL